MTRGPCPTCGGSASNSTNKVIPDPRNAGHLVCPECFGTGHVNCEEVYSQEEHSQGCPSCGADYSIILKFCPGCGAKFPEPKSGLRHRLAKLAARLKL